MLLEPYSLKNTSSPRRRLRLGIFLEKSYLHCPPSVMGSLCPNGLTAFLVRQVQLLVVLVQVPHLYLSPKCLRALRTTSRPEKLSIDFESRVCDLSPEAVTVCSSGGAASPRTPAPASAKAPPPLPPAPPPGGGPRLRSGGRAPAANPGHGVGEDPTPAYRLRSHLHGSPSLLHGEATDLDPHAAALRAPLDPPPPPPP